MKILIAAVFIFGNACSALCAPDSVALTGAKQAATTPAVPKTNANQQSSTVIQQSASQPLVKDSALKKADNNHAATKEKSEGAQSGKTVTPERKTGLEEEDLLIDETEEKKAAANKPPPQQQPVSSVLTDTAAGAQKVLPVSADSQKASAASNPATVSTPAVISDSAPSKAAAAPEKIIQPATVEAVHSINFAKNLKDYRSPKLAMLMSLLVPGLGQAYVKSYVKTSIFVALEATAIGFSVAYNQKGRKQLDEAHSFADQNYNNDNLKAYYGGLFNLISRQYTDNGDSIAHDKLSFIYSDSSFLKGSKYRWQNYYTDMQNDPYVQGWKDCQPKIDQDGNFIAVDQNQYRIDDSTKYMVYAVKNGKIDSTTLRYGYSAGQIRYNAMVSQSNSYYKTAQGILFTLVINHLLSAVDALISAKAYNDALLGRESLWQHISLEQQLVDAGPSLSGGMVMRIQF